MSSIRVEEEDKLKMRLKRLVMEAIYPRDCQRSVPLSYDFLFFSV